MNLSPKPDIPHYEDLMTKLSVADESRIGFLRCCLRKLGLSPNSASQSAPPLTSLHLTSFDNDSVADLLCSWDSIIQKDNGEELIRAEEDTFRIESEEDQVGMEELRDALPATQDTTVGENGVVDYSAIVKRVIAHEKSLPSQKQTPRFNHKLFYTSLKGFQALERGAETWGNVLLYGDVVTSTNKLLER